MVREVILFKAGDCTPCEEVAKLVSEHRFVIEGIHNIGIRVVDVSTEEGFSELQGHQDIDRLPAAKMGDKLCELSVDRETDTLYITCEDEVEGNHNPLEKSKGKFE